MKHNLFDKKILTGDSDVISSHHCGLSGSVIHQAQFSEIFPRLELIHLKCPTHLHTSNSHVFYLLRFLLPVHLLEDHQGAGLNEIHSICSVPL